MGIRFDGVTGTAIPLEYQPPVLLIVGPAPASAPPKDQRTTFRILRGNDDVVRLAPPPQTIVTG